MSVAQEAAATALEADRPADGDCGAARGGEGLRRRAPARARTQRCRPWDRVTSLPSITPSELAQRLSPSAWTRPCPSSTCSPPNRSPKVTPTRSPTRSPTPSSTPSCRRSAGPRRVRNAGHDRHGGGRGRNHHHDLRADSRHRARHGHEDRLHRRHLRFRLPHLRRADLDRPAVARHRDGRGSRKGRATRA